MHPAVKVLTEGARKCGYRKVHGLYLCSNAPVRACGKLPLPLTTCPCCGQGIRFSRSWTWVDSTALFAAAPCLLAENRETMAGCGCPLDKGVGRAGLLWVGEMFYGSPDIYNQEADALGISRRIKFVPHEFELGMWVLLAHRKAIKTAQPTSDNLKNGTLYTPGIFRVFQPDRIEYILDGSESDDDIDALVKRGLTPVLLQKAPEPEQIKMEI